MSQAGLIDIEGSHPQIPTQFDANVGSAVPLVNVLNIVGSGSISTSASGNTVTISGTGGSVDSVSGTANRITISGTATDPIVDIASTYVGQNTITTLGTVTTGTWNGSVVDEVYGGTNQSSYATGDILYASGVNTLSKLPAATDGQVLTLAAGVPSWSTNGSGDVVGSPPSTEHAIARYADVSGLLIENSLVLIDDTGNISQTASVGGATLSNTTSNTSNTASSHAQQLIQVGGTSAGDPYTTWGISGGDSFSMGIDNSVSDKFSLSASATLGTTELLDFRKTGTYTFNGITSGSLTTILLTHPSNTAGSKAYYQARVAGSTADDAYYVAQITGVQSWAWGLDNSDSDKWILSANNTLGTNNAIEVSTTETTITNQLNVDNLRLDGNTLSSTDTNGNINLTPDGTGLVQTSVSSSGNTVQWSVANNDTTAAVDSSANISISSRPEGTGDPSLTVTVAATRSYCFGVDNSDSDSLKINTLTAGGVRPSTGTNQWKMTTAGECTMPLQPAFLAYLGTSDTNATGNGATYTLGGGNALTEVFDQGSDFVTTGTFTAPVTGRYCLSTRITSEGHSVSTTYDIRIVTSNRTYLFTRILLANAYNQTMAVSDICDMDAADTATFQYIVSGEAGNTVDIFGNANAYTDCSGYLAC